MIKVFTETAWDEYLFWQKEDRKILKKINTLIKDIERNGNEGLGNPEPLKHELKEYWSRRIDKKNRLVYSIKDDDILKIFSCKDHY